MNRDDLRMTRLVFDRLGCRMEFDGDDVVVPADQRLRIRDDEGDAVSKIEDGPWPAFPADLTSIALAMATQAEGMVLIFEKMFENRLFFVDKLVSMGARVLLCDPHRAVVSGPSRLHGERMESPDIRAGMAMLIAALCAEGPSEIGNVAPDRPRLRADRRAAARPRGADRAGRVRAHARPGRRLASREAGPNDSPDSARHARRAARRDARAARALGPPARRVRGAGYGEIWTPTLEYEEVLRQGDDRAAGAGFRLFDENGQVMVLRSDMTIPIARVASARYADAEPPLRFSYFAHAYREVERGRGQAAEFLQAGVELLGAAPPGGDAEVIQVVLEALAAAGLGRHRVGVGDGSLYRTLLASFEVPVEERMPLLEALSRRDLVDIETHVDRLGLDPTAAELLTILPTLRGGPEILDRAVGPRGRGGGEPARASASC